LAILKPILDLRAATSIPEMRAGLEAIFFSKEERFLKFLYWETLF
jgi:hypothetical protein